MSKLQIMVGQRLRQMRKEKDLTQAELAEKAGMMDTYLASVERGERNISLESLDRIVKALDARPVEAFQFDGLELSKDQVSKRASLEVLTSFLEGRSLDEIELIRKMTVDVMMTVDIEKRKMT